MMLNNADWLLNLNYVDLLREVGACFSVNNMLRAECYKQRMEKGLSFLEFNYMIMQSYDFYHLYRHYGCNMQFGGDDQWSNMPVSYTHLGIEHLSHHGIGINIILVVQHIAVRFGHHRAQQRCEINRRLFYRQRITGQRILFHTCKMCIRDSRRSVPLKSFAFSPIIMGPPGPPGPRIGFLCCSLMTVRLPSYQAPFRSTGCGRFLCRFHSSSKAPHGCRCRRRCV